MSHRLPPLSALRAFEAAARLGRMTAAAEEVSVTPGAISRQGRLRTTDAGTGEGRMHGDLTITAEEATGAWDTSKEQRLFPEHLGPVLSPELAHRVELRQPAALA